MTILSLLIDIYMETSDVWDEICRYNGNSLEALLELGLTTL